MKFLIFLVASFVVNANAQSVLNESTEDLGGGFKIVHRAEELPNDPKFFEGIGHFSYFYHGNTKLSQTSTFSVSPSKNFALYQDGPSGSIFIYNSKEDNSVVVVEKFHSLVKGLEWNEDSGIAYVSFYETKKSLMVKLNSCIAKSASCKSKK